jgi:hypothetical protein
MSSYYDCSPETNNTKGEVYSNKTTDIINNITGIFILLISIGVTFLIIFGFKTFIEPLVYDSISKTTPITPINSHNIIYLLFLLTFACISTIIGLIGMYIKSPDTSIFGFTSFILIGVYTIFLFISKKLSNLKFPTIINPIIKGLNPMLASIIILVFFMLGLVALYMWEYNNWKKFSLMKSRRVNRERKRKRNTASVILSFSLLGATLLVALVTVYINKDKL